MEPVHGYIEMALLTARDPKSKIIIKLLKLLEFKAIKNKKKRERRLEGKTKKTKSTWNGKWGEKEERELRLLQWPFFYSQQLNWAVTLSSLCFSLWYIRDSLWFLRRRFEANLSWLCVLIGSFYNLIIKAYSITFPKNTTFFFF